jgi:solute carrier family 1 (high affinity glutamate transporter) protein 2
VLCVAKRVRDGGVDWPGDVATLGQKRGAPGEANGMSSPGEPSEGELELVCNEVERDRLLSSNETSSPSRGKQRWAALLRGIRAEPLLFQTLIGVVVGVVVGAVIHSARGRPLTGTGRDLLGLPGELFMRALKCMVVPLIVGSALSGVLTLQSTVANAAAAKSIAKRTLLLYAASMLCSVTIGILCMSLFRPGRGVVFGQACDGSSPTSAAGGPVVKGSDALLNTLRSMVPNNIFSALVGGNVLGLITFSIFTALAIGKGGIEAVQPALAAVTSFNKVVARMVNAILVCMPVCIASLIAGQVVGTCHPLSLLSSLSFFIAVYIMGLLLHAGVVIPLALRLVGRVSPWRVYVGAAPALVTVFATDSSSATLPVTLMCCKSRLNIPDYIVDFVLPLGTTVNMDGTALYEATAVLFIAQVHAVQLGAVGTVVLALTATLAAVGAPAIPSAGTVTMLMVLQATGLEQFSGDIAVLLAVDFILDRLRSMVNVMGDVACTVIVHSLTERQAARQLGGDPTDPPSTTRPVDA